MIRRLVPLVAAGLVLAACGSSDEPSAGSDASVESSGAPSDPSGGSTSAPTSGPGTTDGGTTDDGSAVMPAEAPEVLRFTAPLLGGGDIEMAALAGRPVLLWFWSPW